MSENMSYTTEEIAKLLKISKLTVYDLIKKGELPSYRVGKQMRVDAADLEAYKRRAKAMQAAVAPGAVSAETAGAGAATAAPSPDAPASGVAGGTRPLAFPAASAGAACQLVITGQDVSLDILAKHIEKNVPGVRPLRAYVGSLDSLIAMYRGESDIVSTHLLDGDTGEYNVPYIRKLLVGFPYLVVNLLSRQAGLYVRQGNPLALTGWDDLSRPGLRLVNRERGSGARVLLDEQLRLRGIDPGRLAGYATEQTSHLGVAGKVAAGEADVGVGIEKAALLVGGVDFIPLTVERYDLVMLRKPDNRGWIDAVLSIVRSAAFQDELRAMHGYDLSMTGRIWLET